MEQESKVQGLTRCDGATARRESKVKTATASHDLTVGGQKSKARSRTTLFVCFVVQQYHRHAEAWTPNSPMTLDFGLPSPSPAATSGEIRVSLPVCSASCVLWHDIGMTMSRLVARLG